MLAHKWEGQINHITISQPKLDGMRCIATPEGLFSRNGKPIVGAPHIWDDINNSGIWMEHPDLVIDGELYNHELKNDFNKIISCVRKTKPTYEDLLESEKNIQYHVYDCKVLRQPELGFGGRFTFLYELMLRLQPKFLRIVKTNVIGHQTCIDDPTPEEHIDTLYGLYLEQGYEGQMIRFDEPYENKRSKNLLKRKEFITEEFEILDVEEGIGNRSGMMGRIHFQTAEGRPFTASSRGNEDYYRDLLSNKETYIGKMATVRYQNMTPDGSPRFPVVITVRDYE
jgi:DNA ligase-1